MEIIATLIIAFAVIGLVSNFVFIFFMSANDRLNIDAYYDKKEEEYFDEVDNPKGHSCD
jgi:hypothetical protein